MPRRRSLTAVPIVAGALLAIGGCDSGGGGAAPSTSASAAPPGPVASAPATTAPPYRAFCEEMVALDERTGTADQAAAGADVVDDVIETYTDLAPTAPADIAEELVAVVQRLEAQRDGDDLDDDAVAVADEAALRVASWVDANCHGVSNNPGPPATAPP